MSEADNNFLSVPDGRPTIGPAGANLAYPSGRDAFSLLVSPPSGLGEYVCSLPVRLASEIVDIIKFAIEDPVQVARVGAFAGSTGFKSSYLFEELYKERKKYLEAVVGIKEIWIEERRRVTPPVAERLSAVRAATREGMRSISVLPGPVYDLIDDPNRSYIDKLARMRMSTSPAVQESLAKQVIEGSYSTRDTANKWIQVAKDRAPMLRRVSIVVAAVPIGYSLYKLATPSSPQEQNEAVTALFESGGGIIAGALCVALVPVTFGWSVVGCGVAAIGGGFLLGRAAEAVNTKLQGQH